VIPAERRHHDGLVHAMLWAFENHTDVSWQLDLDRLTRLRRDRGIAVRIYAPESPLGSMLDARETAIRTRIDQGEAALAQPLEL
jgi:hypothetical protein